jgi:hypothetical protein
MALPELHNFERLAKNKPAKGSNDYPVAIKGKDLDENWKMTTLLAGEGEPKLYEVEYTKDGTRITRILPNGTNTGDLLYWDGSKWVVLAATSSSTLHVLGIEDGALKWVETEGCE